MRLGGPVFAAYAGPEEWVRAVGELVYRAAYCPVGEDAAPEEVRAYAAAAKKADIVMAEVGAWSNPLSPDEGTRKAAVAKCKKCLALAEAIGARCCVNIAGSRGAKWDGPCAEDLTEGTFEMVVEVVRDIIDEVRPGRTFYTLETMPWMVPDSVDAYLRLVKAIDRKAFGVHLDPVNLVCSPQIYFRNGEMIGDFISRLGSRIRSCHAKDILLGESLTTHLEEVRPGKGKLDYRRYLRELAKLDADMPLMLEHLPTAEEYAASAGYIRQVAKEEKVVL